MRPELNYADSPLGRLHYAELGDGFPMLMLHQTPRSHDEFAEVQPLMARSGYRAIAMDMLGFGLSAPSAVPQTIEQMAEGALNLMDGLNLPSFVAMGHHTGAVVALELAVRAPERVSALVLSSMPWIGPDRRARAEGALPVDEVSHSRDGSHLTELWQMRAPYYPSDRSDLLERFIRDALAPGVDPAEGHRACSRYEMDNRIGDVRVPTLLIGAEADPFTRPHLETISAALINAPNVGIRVIPDGTIPLMEQCATDVVAHVTRFLEPMQLNASGLDAGGR